MINIKRSETIPESLQDAKIQTYLDALTDWYSDRNKPQPETLAKYRTWDVLALLDEYFHSKCYLTEQRAIESVWEFEIDHFYPKNEFPTLKYEWKNLYPITSDANKMRPKEMPEGGYLDPCEDNDDVEKEILYDLDDMGKRINFAAIDKSNLKAINTAKLLDEVHNGTGKDKNVKQKTAGIREMIREKYTMVTHAVIEWQAAERKGDRQEIFHTENKLKDLLSRKSSFTMLIRSTRIVRFFVPPEFLD